MTEQQRNTMFDERDRSWLHWEALWLCMDEALVNFFVALFTCDRSERTLAF